MKKWLLTMATIATSLTTPPLTQAAEQTAILAGGCFWCIQHDFEDFEAQGLLTTEVGYTGGHTENPTYKEVSKTETGHYEALRIVFDDEKISYETILKRFWPNVDAVDANGQFCDRGNSYRAALFVQNDEQRAIAEKTKELAQKALGEEHRIVTPILDASTFYTGEDYHQHYAQKNPVKYKYYRWRCGRDQRLQSLWGSKNNL